MSSKFSTYDPTDNRQSVYCLIPAEFSMRAAYYIFELNMIHPFREGNGRSIREFIRQLAHSQ